MSDIIEDIDALIDESMARGRDEYGSPLDDYNVNRYPKCGHCNRAWHGLPLTRQVATMYSWGSFDPSYTVEQDDSPIVCLGSEFIGPQPLPPVDDLGPGWTTPQWSGFITGSAGGGSVVTCVGGGGGSWTHFVPAQMVGIQLDLGRLLTWPVGTYTFSTQSGWSTPLGEPWPLPVPTPTCDAELPVIEWGVQHWDAQTFAIMTREEPRALDYRVLQEVRQHWHRDDFVSTLVLPKTPGYDFSALKEAFETEYPTSGDFMSGVKRKKKNGRR